LSASLIQSSVLHDFSEMILIGCWKQFCLIFLWKHFFWRIESSKEEHSFEKYLFSNITNVFSVRFNKMNVLLQNKNLHFSSKKKNRTEPKL